MTSVPASSGSTFSCRLSWNADTRSPGNGGFSSSPNHPQPVSNRTAPNARAAAPRRAGACNSPKPAHHVPHALSSRAVEHLLGSLREARARGGFRVRRLFQGLERRLGFFSVAGRHRREAGDLQRRQAIGLAFLGQVLHQLGGRLGLADLQFQQRRLDRARSRSALSAPRSLAISPRMPRALALSPASIAVSAKRNRASTA